MARVLVLGATGDQGHPLIARLLEAGLTPVAALRNPNAFLGTEFAHVEVDGSRKCDPSSVWRLGAAARSLQGRNRPKPVSGNPPGPPK